MPTITAQTMDEAPNAARQQLERPRATRRVLVVVDGSERTGRIIEQLRSLAANDSQLDAVLLNVQPKPAEGRLRGYGSFKRHDIEAHLLDNLGQRAVGAAGRALAHHGIPHKHRIEIGDAVETILRVAHEERCDLIVMGDSVPGSFRRMLPKATGLTLATLAAQVSQLADVPVMIVK
jgi:nucleotide-binding universal stress UspA family protein